MDAKTLFNQKIPAFLQASPDKAKAIDAIYVFKITGDGGGTWTVDLKATPPSCKEGDAGNSECSIEVTDADFNSMLADPNLGMQLYFQGKLKVSGNPMLATKLQQLFAMGV
ncbi:MAG: SCP2 sterol-binding domain-containing protein [Deltaproteobacteria bacterium]|nr:SCP2 sterol-binding domain-containing protein [Deltaproteobacteria bacterium]